MNNYLKVATVCSSSDSLRITASALAPSYLCFGNGAVKISLQTGKVEFGPGITPDEAATAFWEAVERKFAVFKKRTEGIR